MIDTLNPPLRSTPWGQAAAMQDCTVVVPTYNERENIGALLPRILSHERMRVLVVDDGSPDGTGDIVRSFAAEDERISLIERSGKLGLGRAYIAGFKQALADGAQYICEMDADFSHDPGYLPALLAATESRYDVVLGSRYVRGGATTDWGLGRKFISKGGNIYARLILNLPIADSTGGFRCYRREVLETIDLDTIHSNGYSFQIEMAYRARRAGFTIGEIPIIFPDRRVGQSKMSRRIVAEALITVWKLRFSK